MLTDTEAIGEHARWLQLRGCTATTITARRGVLRRLAASQPLLEAQEADLLAWRAELSVGDMAVINYVSHVRGFYGWAAEVARIIPASPALRIPSPRLPRLLPRPVSEDDVRLALACPPPDIRAWLVLAGWAGLRAREIAYLRRDSIFDRASRPVLLVTTGAGKGGDERVIPLSRFVLAELDRYGLPTSGWAFRRRDGQAGPNSPTRVSFMAGSYLHECGITSALHGFRHRFATQLYAACGDLTVVQSLLGHKKIETTMRYVKWSQVAAAQAVEELPGLDAPGQLAAAADPSGPYAGAAGRLAACRSTPSGRPAWA